MPVLRTLLASLVVLAAGGATLAAATDGFQAFTAETARRIAVSEHPQVVPDLPLEGADGVVRDFGSLRGKWLLVDFIYTRCATYCLAQGGAFAQLQDALAAPIAAGRVVLLSVSFDPRHDDPVQLAAYQRRTGDRGAGWIAARPRGPGEAAELMRAFGVRVVRDELGEYVHNAAINVVDPQGRLVAILDWDAADEARRYVDRGLGR